MRSTPRPLRPARARAALLASLITLGVLLAGSIALVAATLPASPQSNELASLDGHSVQLTGVQYSSRASTSQLLKAYPVYLVAYPYNLSHCAVDCISIPPTYPQPECNASCSQSGLPPEFAYHDTILDTPSDAASPCAANTQVYQVHLVEYRPEVVFLSRPFQPFTSAGEVRDALAGQQTAEQLFVPIGQGEHPYEVSTGLVLTCARLVVHITPATPSTTAGSPEPGDAAGAGARDASPSPSPTAGTAPTGTVPTVTASATPSQEDRSQP
jgi:hypothetical protein